MRGLLKSRIFNLFKWIFILYLVFKGLFFVLRRVEMKNTIKEKSGISVSIFFSEIENRTLYSPTAFDSDYSWMYQIRVGEKDMLSISEQIENSRFFDSKGIYYLGQPIYDSLRVNNLKGFWTKTDLGYEFFPAKEEWAETTKIEIDSKNRTISVDLTHL